MSADADKIPAIIHSVNKIVEIANTISTVIKSISRYAYWVSKKASLTSNVFEEFLPAGLSKAQRRKLEILEAAIALFATHGIDRVTYELLGKQAKASRALIQHYFPDKDELTITTMKYVRAKFQKLAIDMIQDARNPIDQLRAYVDSTFIWIHRHQRDAKVWLLFYYYCSFTPEYFSMNTELVNQGHERICALLRNGIATGDFRLRECEVSAKQIQGVITGSLLEALTERIPASMDLQRVTWEVCKAIALGKLVD